MIRNDKKWCVWECCTEFNYENAHLDWVNNVDSMLDSAARSVETVGNDEETGRRGWIGVAIAEIPAGDTTEPADPGIAEGMSPSRANAMETGVGLKNNSASGSIFKPSIQTRFLSGKLEIRASSPDRLTRYNKYETEMAKWA